MILGRKSNGIILFELKRISLCVTNRRNISFKHVNYLNRYGLFFKDFSEIKCKRKKYIIRNYSNTSGASLDGKKNDIKNTDKDNNSDNNINNDKNNEENKIGIVIKNLPSEEDAKRSAFAKSIGNKMDNFQLTVFLLGQRFNDLTGYSGIEALKKEIEAQERRVRETRLAAKLAKDSYNEAISVRSAAQREINELLERKHSWGSGDLERFTNLYRSEHTNERAENEAQSKLEKAEHAAEEAQADLTKAILSRYHEEQIWSDKIRRASTWGTWGLMTFNVLLFVVVQLGLEPWKRRRLVGSFEEKVKEALREERENALKSSNTLSNITTNEDSSTNSTVVVNGSDKKFTDSASCVDDKSTIIKDTEKTSDGHNLVNKEKNLKEYIDEARIRLAEIMYVCFSFTHITNKLLASSANSDTDKMEITVKREEVYSLISVAIICGAFFSILLEHLY